MKSSTHSLSTWKNVALIGIFTLLLVACGDDSKAAGGTEEDSAVTAIKDKVVSGVSQKGPFVKGASVTVYELDSKSLSQTGRSYEGKIKNERGEFSVDVVKLESQYALLKADGYYRNEITGEKSNSTVTLYAMTDLSNRDEVNVNLLTHLEYERSRYLVKYEKLGVDKAKMQAEREVLKSFGIEDELDNSEDLNIFGDDDGGAALLAISVLMQGDLKEADFTERLTDYADDLEEDGAWDDEKIAAKIADWAYQKSFNGGLAKIRKNIAGWELSTEVPAFEKYVDNYWWHNYGLGACNEKREGEVKKNQNSLSSNYGFYFICDDGGWRVASDIEYDTYKWSELTKNAKDGDVKYGDVVNTNCYVFENNVWRSGNANDCSLGLRGCTTLRQDTVGMGSDKVYYICNARSWRNATSIEKDTYKQKCSEYGQIVHGNVNKENAYFCYGTEWKRFYGNESVIYGKLEDKRDGKIYRTVKIGTQTWMAENLNYDDSVFSSIGPNWCETDMDSCAMFGRYYSGVSPGLCPEGWHVPTFDEWNILYVSMESSSNAMQAKGFAVWDSATDEFGFSVLPAGLYCDELRGERFYDGFGTYAIFQMIGNRDGWGLSATDVGRFDNDYYCGDKATRYGSVRCLQDDEVHAEVTIGSMIDVRDGQTYKTVSINAQTWMAENLNYKVDSSFCYDRQENSCSKYGRLYRWTAVISNPENDSVQGICPSGWHLPSMAEWETLISVAGGQAGKILKSTSGWNHRGNGTDAFSFSALPAGYWFGGFGDEEGSSANFWSSTEYDSESVYYMSLDYRMDTVFLRRGSKYDAYSFGFSVRCVKD